MFAVNRSKMETLAVSAVMAWFAVSSNLAAATTAPNVTYKASGVFANPPVSGTDEFRLAGEPFSMSVVANAALTPTRHGAQWAQYNDLSMTGTVQSGLVPTPIAIANSTTDILLATGNPNVDFFELGSPILVVGLKMTVSARISMPKGTIANALIHPFTAPVTLTPANALMTYTYGTVSATLGINGTLSTSLSQALATPDSAAAPVLHGAGAQAITHRADGTQSIRPVQAGPVDLGSSTDTVALQFYASGISGASSVRAQVAGQDVPVLYAGPSGRFPGLDQVSVQLPRSLAGSGDVGVVVIANGQSSNPVHVRIQ